MLNFYLQDFCRPAFLQQAPLTYKPWDWATSELAECIQLAEYIRQLLTRKKKSFAAFCLLTGLSLTVGMHLANTSLSPIKWHSLDVEMSLKLPDCWPATMSIKLSSSFFVFFVETWAYLNYFAYMHPEKRKRGADISWRTSDHSVFKLLALESRRLHQVMKCQQTV